MITLQSIIKLISPALDNDEELQTYCQVQFSKQPLIFSGIDTANPPSQDDCPYISIIPYNKDVGEGQQDFDFNLFLDVVVKGKDTPLKNGNIVEYEGLYQAEDLALHVQRVVNKAVCGLDIKVFYIPAEIRTFPVYAGIIVLTVSSPNVIGSDELTIGG